VGGACGGGGNDGGAEKGVAGGAGGGRLNWAKKAAVLAPRAAAEGAEAGSTKGAELIFTLLPHPMDSV
jgi:hypothetical protein